MEKRFHTIVILALACLLCGCADRQGQGNLPGEGSIPTESLQDTAEKEETKGTASDAAEASGETAYSTETSKKTVSGETVQSIESGTKEAQAAEGSGAKDAIWFLGKDANAGFGFTAEEYDYVFNFKGFYLSYDGKGEQIFIDPIEFVWPEETERWPAWGFSLDEPGTYSSRNGKEELISIPITGDTEFHMYNGSDDPTLEELSDRHNGRECVTTKPEVFLYRAKSNLYGPLTDWPFFMILDEEGNVKYVVEHPLVG